MSTSKPIRLTGADEWLLSAIRSASPKKGASLTDVIAAGDMINRAIFSPAELRSGFAKLLAANYISEKNGRWFIRERGRSKNVVADSKTWPDPRVQDPDWRYPLTDEEIQAAIRGYLGS